MRVLSLLDIDENRSPSGCLQLESFPQKNALIASLQPPNEPPVAVHHVPCDIVLVIDVSGSMFDAAPVPGESESEANGLSILDLVKHAALTIIETMDERDRLSIVTFASSVTVLQPLECMTDENKKTSRNNINSMVPKDATNLWHGILTGLKQFEGVNSDGKVPAIMVLTDGMPNHMCPPAGYIPKLRTKLPLPATIHTFGFGYSLQSGLLKSIAEIGNGNYSFIPDAGMIGTVFVHAVANLQSTYATEATLNLRYGPDTQIREAMGTSVLTSLPEPFVEPSQSGTQLCLPLGNIQYGQSRDVFLHFHSPHVSQLCGMNPGPLPIVEATIAYKLVLGNAKGNYTSTTVTHNLMEKSSMPEETVAYHESRAQICSFLSGLFPIEKQGVHAASAMGSDFEQITADLEALIEKLPSRKFSDPLNKSLMQDLAGEEPEGQISIALSKDSFFWKWGQHYLPSFLNAHTRQVCNSFKDPGPLQYGCNSSLFITCRDRLDEAFDNLPAPEPSRHKEIARSHGVRGFAFPISSASTSMGSYTPISTASVSMSSYRNSRGVCFAGTTLVQLASGRDVEIRRLRRGMKLQTPLGSRKVTAVLRTPVKDETLCRVGSVLVTPWHPISLDGKTWTFPADVAEKAVRFTGSVYSIMLQRDRNPDAHALRLDGLWGVTLGHGVTSGGDVRAHVFFGDYMEVCKSLKSLAVGPRGEFIGGGVGRDAHNGLVCSFTKDASRGRPLTWSDSVRGKDILRS
ncbi:von Willebrand factor, type A [Cordyceps fumosorosea ARSEF 2679]|uniref:von Willebrand factor, type A n=1 Tax=Cordyceps fumosorosea (strain ARSEF 2679) TaxID=1081104 RepID=A0A162LHD7_CORFA|nr:von Willebrand factor, type A [Cordyceps fumosorosea ARSEF 2679]OAA70624.1 von Willebrand factor, type A [Cordyceps fumosorosea ARSEF 2679]